MYILSTVVPYIYGYSHQQLPCHVDTIFWNRAFINLFNLPLSHYFDSQKGGRVIGGALYSNMQPHDQI